MHAYERFRRRLLKQKNIAPTKIQTEMNKTMGNGHMECDCIQLHGCTTLLVLLAGAAPGRIGRPGIQVATPPSRVPPPCASLACC